MSFLKNVKKFWDDWQKSGDPPEEISDEEEEVPPTPEKDKNDEVAVAKTDIVGLSEVDVVSVGIGESDNNENTKSSVTSATASTSGVETISSTVGEPPLPSSLISISPEGKIKFDSIYINTIQSKTFRITNSADEKCNLKSISFCGKFGEQNVVTFTFTVISDSTDGAVEFIPPNSSITVQIFCKAEMMGKAEESISFVLELFDNEEVFTRTLEATSISVKECLFTDLSLVQLYFDHHDLINRMNKKYQIVKDETEKNKEDNKAYKTNKNNTKRPFKRILPSTSCVRNAFFTENILPKFYPVPKMRKALLTCKSRKQLGFHFPEVCEELSFSNYASKLHINLWIDDFFNEMERRKLDLEDIELKYEEGISWSFIAKGIKEFDPPILVGERVIIIDENDKEYNYYGFLEMVEKGTEIVHIKISEQFNRKESHGRVAIQFQHGRRRYIHCHYAVDVVKDYLGENLLFPTQAEIKTPKIDFFENDIENKSQSQNGKEGASGGMLLSRKFKKRPLKPSVIDETIPLDIRAPNIREFSLDGKEEKNIKDVMLTWINKNLIEDQKNAVRTILRGQCRPLPFLLLGFPGTGKTTTLIESVLQIYTLDKSSRILICASSNSGADQITSRLIKTGILEIGDFVELIGLSRQTGLIPGEIFPYCQYPDNINHVIKFRLIVTTCITAGRFFEMNKEAHFFNYVFLDDAGNFNEPEAMIPISLVNIQLGGQIILVGDLKSIGPDHKINPFANQLEESILSRYLNTPLYKNKEKNDPILMIELTKGKRCLDSIIQFPSYEFYNGRLTSYLSKEEFLILNCDLNKSLIFYGIHAESQSDSFSHWNISEAIQISLIIEELFDNGVKPQDIIVITPYKKQQNIIKKLVNSEQQQDKNLKIGSVGEFTGVESKVVIVSTVLTSERKSECEFNNKSFIDNKRRFNFAITRARCLFIVVGNPHFLIKDEIWKKFLNRCVTLNFYVGTNLPLELCKNPENKGNDNLQSTTTTTVTYAENDEGFSDSDREFE